MCVPVRMKINGDIAYNLMKGKTSLANKLKGDAMNLTLMFEVLGHLVLSF